MAHFYRLKPVGTGLYPTKTSWSHETQGHNEKLILAEDCHNGFFFTVSHDEAGLKTSLFTRQSELLLSMRNYGRVLYASQDDQRTLALIALTRADGFFVDLVTCETG